MIELAVIKKISKKSYVVWNQRRNWIERCSLCGIFYATLCLFEW